MILRIVAVLLGLALIAPGLAHAQTRQEKIAEIVRILVAVDHPRLREEGVPAHARSEAGAQLSRLGTQAELGPEWKSGNTYWDRAEKLLRDDYLGALDRGLARVRQPEASFRETLGELADAQLDAVLEFYRSDLFRKWVQAADGLIAAIMRATLAIRQRADVQTSPDLKGLERGRGWLTDGEEQLVSEFHQSPAYQLMNRGALGALLASISDPYSTMIRAPFSAGTARAVGQLVAQFREAHGIPLPLPPAYEADFKSKPQKEKSLRESANAATRGDIQALARIQQAAASGDPIAQVELGRLHQLGRGVPKDEKAAFDWTQRAAEQGLPRAQFNLGVHYEHGIGVKPSLADAVENYRRAAERGFARAQLALGLKYRTGNGVPQDFQRSLQLIEAAAKQYLPAAQLAMAEIYDAGAGIGRDAREADEWLGRAQNQGYPPASQYRAQRKTRTAELLALLEASPATALASATAVDKPELNRRLIAAVKRGNIANVRELLDAGADIEARDERPHTDETPLHHAARTGNVQLASLLVARGANVNAGARGGFTPLHVAAGLNQRAVAEYLLGAGANPNAQDSGAGTPLHAATVQGHAFMVALLLEKGADPNSRRARDAATPLHMFSDIGRYIEPGHTRIIETLALRGADLNATNKDGRTPLDGAHQQAISALIVHGAQPSRKKGPYELLRRAAESGRGEPLAYLEQRGHSLTAKGPDGRTLLHVAAAQDDPRAMHYLISRGLDVNAADDSGKTPLYFAVSACRKPNVDLLIEKGARARNVSAQGLTALHAILGSGFPFYWERCEETVLALLDAGPETRIRDPGGTTPLHVAAGQERLLEKLLSQGADPRATDDKGQTPLHVYPYYGKRAQSVDALVKAGADPNAQDALGRTPLHMFSEWGVGEERLAIARALVRNGARIDVRDAKSETPLQAYAKTPWGQNPQGWGDVPFIKLLKGEIPPRP
jgi:cytohesin